ncbi:hypothetical protein AWZ03_008610 [Drosophila navojoa]|uniref:Uncharacterized protein n=1 Tax=Drosophila navojoa TaxID=7232 RepID=A0A484B8G8_DRONA|nr:uncharacterized protein LOC115563264 [Drosophila navojoa]TDG44988.1 hypothetical protein AWZ03_008610 [Drosophila navojoa]
MDNVVVPPYGKEVLVGNWIDRRYASDEKSNAILPGLGTFAGCDRHLSISKESYTDAAQKSQDRMISFGEIRRSRMRNFFAGTTSNVIFIDDLTMNDNFTTTNTLFYDLLPRLSQQRQQRQLNMLLSYGNLTKTVGITKNAQFDRRPEKALRMRSIYDTSYNHYPKTRTNFHL